MPGATEGKTRIETRELTPALWPAVESLFGPNGAGAGRRGMLRRLEKDGSRSRVRGAPARRRLKAPGRAHDEPRCRKTL